MESARTGVRIPLREAWTLGEAILSVLSPFCERIELVGSLRRARPDCGDIDIVCLPRPGGELELRARAKQRSCVVAEGDQTLIVETRAGVQVDIWMARHPRQELFGSVPGNWGSLVLCRTGSRQHNIWLATRAKSIGLRWQPHAGVMDANAAIVACDTEEEIYSALRLQWVPPAFREQEFLDGRWSFEPKSPPAKRALTGRDAEWIAQTRARLAAISQVAAARFDALVARHSGKPI